MSDKNKGTNVPQEELDAPTKVVASTRPTDEELAQIEFKLVPSAYSSRLRAFGKPVAYKDPAGLEKFGVSHYQTFTCPLPGGSTLRFTSFDEKFIKAVDNDDVAEFYYKPAPNDVGGTWEIDYRTTKQVSNVRNQETAKRSADLLANLLTIESIESSQGLKERLLSQSMASILNASA